VGNCSHLGKGQEVEEYSESPYVYGKVVGPFEGHFGGKIFLGAAEGGVYPPGRSGLDELCATKVGNNKMTGDIDKNILRFQVSMDDPGLVESFDRKGQFAGIKLSRIWVERTISHQMSEKVPSSTKVLFLTVSTRRPRVARHLL